MKKTFGFTKKQPKPRTKVEIDQSYNFHGVSFAHKARMVSQFEEEMCGHLEQMKRDSAEALKLPPPDPTPPATAMTEGSAP